MKSKPQVLIIRQGDVLLIAIDAIPAGAKDVTPEDRIVLAHGEVTGHAHALYEPLTKTKPAGKARAWDAGAERFLQVVTETPVRHEEHGHIPVPPGNYKIVQQREYSPEAIRNVAD